MIKINPTRITTRPYLSEALDNLHTMMTADYKNVDYTGIRLTNIEKEYYKRNEVEIISSEDTYSFPNPFNHWPVFQPWISFEEHPNIFLNYSYLSTRYAFAGRALYEIEKTKKITPEAIRLTLIKPFYQLSFSVEWIDETGCYEILNIRKNYTDHRLLKFEKELLEDQFKATDWVLDARWLLAKKDEWIDLDFTEANNYKRIYFGIDV